MKKILSIFLVVAMLFTLSISAMANEGDYKIKVAINAEFAPFEYYENGTLTGFDIDLMNEICNAAGYEIEYIDMPFDSLFYAIALGKADCAISTITFTEERDAVVDFSVPYLEAKVAHKDGFYNYESRERYCIIFKEGLANSYVKSSVPTREEKLFMVLDDAIRTAVKDGTVAALVERYGLDEVEVTEYADYEYFIPEYDDGFDIIDTEIALTIPAPSEWAKESIEKAAEWNITDKAKSYYYAKPITREEFCELVYNYCASSIDKLVVDGENPFTDTNNTKILFLYVMGIISGKSETEFAPNDYLTREEAAVILNRMINETKPVPVTEMYFVFDDQEQISSWAMNSVQVMCNMGVMNGVGENKFAPQDEYTTEQAIATLVKVYEAQNPSDEIIESFDTPTEIVVTETIEVDDFYVNEAIKLAEESGKLAGDKDFISYYTANEDMVEKISALGDVNWSEPTEIYYMAADREKIAENIKALLGDEAEGFDIEKLLELNRVNFTQLASMINAFYGAEALAAVSVLTNSEGYIMPEDFEKDFALFLKYEGEYSALVSFSEFGEGVISAQMTFVKNGDKYNVLTLLYEITQGLGEDSIDIALVK